MKAESSQQAIFLASSLVAGCLQVAVSALPRPEGLAPLPSLLTVLSLTVLSLWVAQEVLWALSVWFLGRRRQHRPAAPLALAIAALTLTVASLWPAFGFLRLTLKAQAVVYPAFLAMVILAPLGAYLAGDRWASAAAARATGRALALTAPAIACEGLLLLWLLHVHGDGFPGVIPMLGFFITAAAVTAAAVWASRRFRPLPSLVILALILLASPAATLLAIDEAGHPTARTRVPAGRPPCILLVTIDTLRADGVDGADGADGETWAPAIQALGRDSVTFTQARSAAPWTKPGIASLLTGLSPLVHRATRLDSRLPDGVETLAEQLQAAGYATAAIGRNTTLDRRYHYDQGFDEYHFSAGNGLGDSLGGALLTAIWPARYRVSWSSRDLTTRAIAWIRAHGDRPFFLWLHYLDPHVPYAPPRELLPAGPPPEAMGLTFDDLYAVRTGRLLSAAERQWVEDLYRAEVRDVDANVGALLRALEELDLYEPCLLVLTSDHGEELWEHGGFEHGHSLYDELLRVPLSFKLPHRRATGRIEASVSTESVTPTVLEVAGIGDRETAFTAPSLRSWWSDPPAAERRGAVVSAGTLYFDDKVSVVFDGRKYIRSRITGREELYDLRSDAEETISLLPGATGAVLQEARQLLADHAGRCQALSQALGISPETLGDEQRELRDRLRSLGYVR